MFRLPTFAVLTLLFPLLLPFTASPARAQTAAVPQSREQITLSYAPVVRKAAPAVVNIFTKKVVRERALSPLFDDPLFRQFFGQDSPFGMPRERVQNSLGSGVIVRPDGLIVTNAHVIKDADQIRVVLHDRREFEATLVSADPRVDLAVLRIQAGAEKLPSLELRDSDEIEVGDLVLAIGNPFGVGQTVTSGIVSAVARTAVGVSDYSFFIQTDAAINPGNSGGPLVTMDGRIAGINTAIFSRSGGSIGIGFAIPGNMVRSVLAAVAHGGKLIRPWLGFSGQPVTADIAASLGLARPAGVLVKAVDARSPAGQAGLRVGDVVVSLNGREIDDPDSLRFRAATEPVGSTASLGVIRGGSERALSFPLRAPPEDPPRDRALIDGRNPLTGAAVANLSPLLAEEIDFAGIPQGVVILEVGRGTPAAQIGFRPGDVVLRVNDRDIGSVRELREAVRGRVPSWSISVRRDGQVFNTTVRG
jgi:serine protease Do